MYIQAEACPGTTWVIGESDDRELKEDEVDGRDADPGHQQERDLLRTWQLILICG
jgi:hypothetical protein